MISLTHPRRSRGLRLVALALAVSTALFVMPLPGARALAQGPPGDIMEEAGELLRGGQYQEAIELLQGFLADVDTPAGVETRQQGYLYLTQALIMRSNQFRVDGDDQTADLYVSQAEAVARECLETPELRRTRPVPEVEFPAAMVELFRDLRSEMFGAFAVTELEPADAVVILGGDTLSVPSGEGLPGDADIPVGTHQVTVAADGYRELVEEVEIEPGTTLARSYQLQKGRGFMWYAGRGALVAAAAVGVALIASGGSDSGGAPAALADPPAPPAR